MNALGATGGSAVTYYKDALPVFQAKCANCHRPGQVAPMSLLTYDSARPWAKAIKAAILERKMPPGQGFSGDHFSEQRAQMTLSGSQVQTLVSWVDGGALKGSEKDAPAPAVYDKQGWSIRPDVVFESPVDYQIPSSGVVPWTDYLIPYKFEKDTLVSAVEMIPSDPSHTHHYVVFIIPPGPETEMLDHWNPAKPLPFNPMHHIFSKGVSLLAKSDGVPREVGGFLMEWTPGQNVQRYDTDNSAKLVRAGSRLIINVHYTTDGKASHDRPRGAFQIADATHNKLIYPLAEPDGVMERDLAIPPGDPNYALQEHMVFKEKATIVSLHPHMHLRGKDYKVTLTYPDGEQEVLIDIPHYDFNWQIVYYPDKPVQVPVGTRLDILGHYDNSENNRNNPDPTETVRWGEQNWEEMFNLVANVAISENTDPRHVISEVKR
jgi:hypothetical protein